MALFSDLRMTCPISRADVNDRSSMARVVKCTAFLADLRDWPAMNEVYVTFFPGARPARSAVGVKELLYGARVEIECIAAAR